MSKKEEKTSKTKLASERKKVKFPKPGELVKTSPALCSYCFYSAVTGGGHMFICDYFLVTKKLRGCKCGECNKFLMGKQKKRMSRMSF